MLAPRCLSHQQKWSRETVKHMADGCPRRQVQGRGGEGRAWQAERGCRRVRLTTSLVQNELDLSQNYGDTCSEW